MCSNLFLIKISNLIFRINRLSHLLRQFPYRHFINTHFICIIRNKQPWINAPGGGGGSSSVEPPRDSADRKSHKECRRREPPSPLRGGGGEGWLATARFPERNFNFFPESPRRLLRPCDARISREELRRRGNRGTEGEGRVEYNRGAEGVSTYTGGEGRLGSNYLNIRRRRRERLERGNISRLRAILRQ